MEEIGPRLHSVLVTCHTLIISGVREGQLLYSQVIGHKLQYDWLNIYLPKVAQDYNIIYCTETLITKYSLSFPRIRRTGKATPPFS